MAELFCAASTHSGTPGKGSSPVDLLFQIAKGCPKLPVRTGGSRGSRCFGDNVMAAKKKAEVVEVVPVQTVSDSTLDQTPARALTFLRGAIRVEIARLLAGVGYGEADHSEGWTLLHAASGYSPSDATTVLQGGATDEDVAAAVRFVDAFDEDGFRITEAALRRHFPEVNEFVMTGLTAKKGVAALIDVQTFLDPTPLKPRSVGRLHGARAPSWRYSGVGALWTSPTSTGG